VTVTVVRRRSGRRLCVRALVRAQLGRDVVNLDLLVRGARGGLLVIKLIARFMEQNALLPARQHPTAHLDAARELVKREGDQPRKLCHNRVARAVASVDARRT
jgi:hypothetical protein